MLTPKQEKFCQDYVLTGNATQAYKLSYSASNMKPESINRAAKALIDNVNISARIKELREKIAEVAQITLESHLKELKILRNMAVRDKKWGAAIQAEIARGKAAGLYVEKVDVDQKQQIKIEIVRFSEKMQFSSGNMNEITQ